MKGKKAIKPEEKYTLDEAYKKILAIKKQMGIPEYQERELKQAFQNGYAKALNDLQEETRKRAGLLAAINVFN